jgi:hypothetical protein
VFDNFGHGLPNRSGLHAGSGHHGDKNVAVEHSGHRYAFSGGFNADGALYGVHEGLTVVRSGAADQGSIDIEQYECVYLFQPFTIAVAQGFLPVWIVGDTLLGQCFPISKNRLPVSTFEVPQRFFHGTGCEQCMCGFNVSD